MAIESQGPGFVLGRPPTTDDELYWMVKALWGVTIPRGKVCPEHCSPFQAFADAYFGRNSIDPESSVTSIALWHGSRGLSGKSFMLSILGLTKAFMMGCDVNLLGGSFAQSANIHEHMRAALEFKNAPRYMLKDEGAQVMKLTNRARIRPLTASQRTVRGPHPPFLLLDEIDEMELAILDAALGQPMRQKNYLGEWVEPYTVMCSTWQNAEGTFTEIYKRADEKNIPKYTWCYKDTANPEDGWLTEKAIEEKKASIPAEMWRVEYELGEPSIGNRAFDSEAVERMFSLPMEPLRKKEAKDYEEYVFADPEHPGTYIIGADWAKEQDYTVITVIRTDRVDTQGLELVYWARLNRRPYPFMVKMFNDAMQRYGAQGEYDRTGLGNVVADYIDDRAHGFMMTGDKRASMLSEYVNAVERDMFKVPRIPTAYVSHKYAQVGDLYSNAKAQGFHLPDEVCALALAYYRFSKGGAPAIPLVMGKGKDTNRYARHFEVDNRNEHDPTAEPIEGQVHMPEKRKRGNELSLMA
jgi:hypothetical protein